MDKYRRNRYASNRQVKISPQKVNRLKRRLLRILVIFVFIWSLLGFVRSDFFRLETVEIHGNTYTPDTEIRHAMQVAEGINVWKVSTALLEERIHTIPRIDSVQVQRDLPRTLVVQVLEKKTLALVPYGEYLLEVGYDGQVIGTTQDPQKYGLPLLTGVAPVEVNVGQSLLAPEILVMVAEVVAAMDAQGIPVSELNMAEEANVVLVTMDGLVVWLGNGSFSEKAALLSQIMGQLTERKADGYLDLRVTKAPTFHILN